MHDRIAARGAGAIACALLALAPLPALAELIEFQCELTGTSAVPPNDSKATGSVVMTLDTDTLSLSYTIRYSGLSGPVTAAHFHGPAAPGTNGRPELPVASLSLASPIQGQATLSAAKAADLVRGLWYLNLHDAAYPSGEIRGQLVKRAAVAAGAKASPAPADPRANGRSP
ncbi:MAG TPA: CHRD domain-containing protein [Myxococcota bacterium]|nr:CHRD domain-containing protein [Myxococcota bacterium]